MTVSTFLQSNFNTQDPATYKAAIDGNFAVLKRAAGAFAPHALAVPDMTVALDAGYLFDGSTLIEVAAQTSGSIAAPAGNPRIDRVVVDRATGAVSVIAGSEAASPIPPAIPYGKLPAAQVLLQTGSTSITDAMITDERAAQNAPAATGFWTPVLKFGGAATGIAYGTQYGRWRRIGGRVDFSAHIVLSSKGSAAGNATVEGLPFAAADSGHAAPVQLIPGSNFSGLVGALYGQVSDGGTAMLLGQMTATTGTSLTDANFSNTAAFFIAGSYWA